ncbi:hypothetical protein BD777DRAFT_129074 [Yarrowia lipolytica]|nr:hypothetical protein BD777DRAFT_129074 [Yarrowia lipolytica]
MCNGGCVMVVCWSCMFRSCCKHRRRSQISACPARRCIYRYPGPSCKRRRELCGCPWLRPRRRPSESTQWSYRPQTQWLQWPALQSGSGWQTGSLRRSCW